MLFEFLGRSSAVIVPEVAPHILDWTDLISLCSLPEPHAARTKRDITTSSNNKRCIHSPLCSVHSVGAGGRWSLRRSGRGDGVGLR